MKNLDQHTSQDSLGFLTKQHRRIIENQTLNDLNVTNYLEPWVEHDVRLSFSKYRRKQWTMNSKFVCSFFWEFNKPMELSPWHHTVGHLLRPAAKKHATHTWDWRVDAKVLASLWNERLLSGCYAGNAARNASEIRYFAYSTNFEMRCGLNDLSSGKLT